MDFREHELLWTDDKTRRFWDWMSNEPAYDRLYFSKVFGEALVDFAVRYGKLRRSGAILDFGCGPGYLLEALLRSGFACSGAEFSTGTIEKAIAYLANNRLFGGIIQIDQLPISKPDESFDFIFLIETVEHLRPETMDATVREIYRILKQRGRLMVTTPYREVLEASSVLCPDCGATFHRMQHVKSWTEDALRVEMEARGFKTVLCRGTKLFNPGLEGLVFRCLRAAKSVMLRNSSNHEHLIYIGEK